MRRQRRGGMNRRQVLRGMLGAAAVGVGAHTAAGGGFPPQQPQIAVVIGAPAAAPPTTHATHGGATPPSPSAAAANLAAAAAEVSTTSAQLESSQQLTGVLGLGHSVLQSATPLWLVDVNTQSRTQ